jgi:hypothetical protein
MPQLTRILRVPAEPCRFHRSEEGQVLVEYILMLLVAIGLLVGIQSSFRKSVFAVWKQFAKEIASACPKNCAPPPDIN